MITQTIRSRGFAFAVHLGLWLVLVLALMDFGAKRLPYSESTRFSIPASSPAPVGKLDQLFSPANLPTNPAAVTNRPNPFFTRHFVPPPAPPPAPPPTTRKIDLTYRGFMQSADKGRHVMINLDTNLVVLNLGQAVATNIFVAEASIQLLTLTNLTAQTNTFPLNVPGHIEVPIQ
jgi:hypothetical protein